METKTGWKRTIASIATVLFLGSALQAQENCPAEIKLLLSPPTVQSVIASLRFEKEQGGRIYFFDTDKLDLLTQGVIVRIRQGSNNDLIVKVRVPEGNTQIDASRLREQFQCEIDLTATGENTSYTVGRKYKPGEIPATGADVLSALSPPQRKLLQEARVSIDWSQVRRVSDIKSTKWETRGRSPFRKLALELWEWPAGNILELSTKVGPDEVQSKSEELQGLVNAKNISLSASQGTKTRTVLETATHPASPPK
jgi:hypothetical protein